VGAAGLEAEREADVVGEPVGGFGVRNKLSAKYFGRTYSMPVDKRHTWIWPSVVSFLRSPTPSPIGRARSPRR
jgi:hypothetical protein